MSTNTLKVVIPMAGFGTRLRPQTWSRPKQLFSMAGRSALSHVLDTLGTLPENMDVEYIFIIGYLGEKTKAYMDRVYPDLKVRYVYQNEMRGQSHAIYLAKEYLTGPMLMVFADTLIETSLSFLDKEEKDVVGWVKPVPDPRRFGVAQVDEGGNVTRLVEKPKDMSNNLAVVGFYYFKEAEKLIAAIEEQIKRDIQLKSEFFLADAINIMLEKGASMRTEEITTWLDAGTPDAVLDTNQFLLDHGRDNTADACKREGISIVPPVFIHPSAKVTGSVIGPHVSIGAECEIHNSILKNSIVEDGSHLESVNLIDSLIGENTEVTGDVGTINIGDTSKLKL